MPRFLPFHLALLPLLLGLCLTGFVGCAEGTSSQVTRPPADDDTSVPDGGTVDAATDAQQPDLDGANPGDAQADTPVLPDLPSEICILGSNLPQGECIDATALEFGQVPQNSEGVRRMRLENPVAGQTLLLLDVEIAPAQSLASDSVVTPRIYFLTEAPNQPGEFIESIVTFPAELEPGQHLHVDLLLEAGAIAGRVPVEGVDFMLEENEILTVAVTGTIAPCAQGTANCDGLLETRCETDVSSDIQNCGACASICELDNADAQCVNGACQIQGECPSGWANCDGNSATGCETNLSTDPNHCGSCATTCNLAMTTGQCHSGTCTYQCNAGFDDCNSDLGLPGSDGCETDILNYETDCGGCGMACELSNALASCFQGQCSLEACEAAHFASCDNNQATGCETNLNSNVAHCGSCDSPCEFDNATPRCVDQACEIASCNPNWGNCDSNLATGCETDHYNDINNCGACGTICQQPMADGQCDAGTCAYQCLDGFGDCNNNLDLPNSDGCETNILTTPAHCGGCGLACNLANAVPSCSDGQCAVASCNTTFANCDNNDVTGCEINLATTVAHCGGCNSPCQLANATPRCVDQGCEVASCNSGFRSCDFNHATGCETNINTNVNNCGACGTTCNLPAAIGQCNAGSCSYQCAPGFADCNGDLGLPNSDGCETNLLTSTTHCGGCGNTCNLANAAPWCSGGQCAVASCDSGFANCDNNDANGCEININNNVAHCGGCNSPCQLANATPRCVQQGCEVNNCNTGYGNCDNNHATGCESNLYNDLNNCGGCGQICSFPNALAQCQAPGNCNFAGCLQGWVNLDGSLSTGCEYQCTPNNSFPDVPQDVTRPGYNNDASDTNCDGIDGDASRALFVAIDGSDTFSGSRQAPLRNIQTAINRAANSGGIDHVYVSTGTYFERIILARGVSVYGGFSRNNNWRRSPDYIVTVENSTPEVNRNVIAMQGTNITVLNGQRTNIVNLTIRSVGASGLNTQTGQGASSYGVHCVSCPGLSLIGNNIVGGTGAQGQAGSNGSSGSNGFAGGNGTAGDHDGSTRGIGGAGGFSNCSRPGGRGGDGGPRGNNYGDNGSPGTLFTPGGAGGQGGNPGRAGGVGSNGASGGMGANGLGGNSSGSLFGNAWRGTNGNIGALGIHGNGGGGGGGGGGQGCTFCINGAGNGGGGGGGGGCGGTGGTGGTSGGGSFGLFLINSTGIVVQDNNIRSGSGGTGGAGAGGGFGGSGGARGFGNTWRTSEIGAGGDGGWGGSAGRGGFGGGGAGGPTIPVILNGTSLNPAANNLLTPGSPGQGGFSSGNNGATGLSTPVHNL